MIAPASAGLRQVDEHVLTAPLMQNIPCAHSINAGCAARTQGSKDTFSVLAAASPVLGACARRALMGLLGVWNISYLDLNVRAVLPYSQALGRFPAHIQQLDMESNGKGVSIDGQPLPYSLSLSRSLSRSRALSRSLSL